jgi:hypothetical protein
MCAVISAVKPKSLVTQCSKNNKLQDFANEIKEVLLKIIDQSVKMQNIKKPVMPLIWGWLVWLNFNYGKYERPVLTFHIKYFSKALLLKS